MTPSSPLRDAPSPPDAPRWTDSLRAEFPALAGVRIAVVGYVLVSPVTGEIQTGGTETYAATLAEVARGLGGDVVFLQRSRTPFAPREVRPGLSARSWARPRDVGPLLRAVREEAGARPTVTLLFVEDYLPDVADHPSVFLHHGILDDGAFERRPRSRLMGWVRDVRKLWVWHRRRRRHFRMVTRTTRTVAVDTNVGNVTRFMFPQLEWGGRIEYVPNFGTLLPRAEVVAKWRDLHAPTTVLFARRFVMKRGTFLWADVLREIAPRYPEVQFRCVGRGPGEPWLRELAARQANVKVLERPHDEMVEEHRRAHISAVPSLWSEGTSLSAIEAMCAGAAVVSTDVGGLGNLVIPNATGLIAPATPDAFGAALRRLLDDRALARRLALSGHRAAAASFSHSAWARRMCRVLAGVLADPTPRSPVRRVAPAPGVE
ncbi:glycosyltransferase family 4 protein [Anaeromyxobacter sp. Fw109-5]|uniref:glycosyltransferase family 4 protein n=1 Tax=Anaeromyxobacter sp. (strain Fw109-5) TaxID=404589 RepID=UPI0000ED78C6|nr:glycosyltransferase family 4 protein [Anaeromyxobacter sp. Fw109-5]ABS24594.1 glycosyl transferase group 1 [Anaeromyxobacter sp. Fw109-5]